MGLLVLIIILAIAWRLLFKDRKAEWRLGVPVRRVVSADVGIDTPRSRLFSKEHRVMGSPDCVKEDLITPRKTALLPEPVERNNN